MEHRGLSEQRGQSVRCYVILWSRCVELCMPSRVNPSVNSGLQLLIIYCYGLTSCSEYSTLMQGVNERVHQGGVVHRNSVVTLNFSVNLEML